MPWFKVDDQCALHPKVVKAGNAAFGAWVRMGCYCNQQLTDGFVMESVARMMATARELESMCSAGLAHKVDDGYQIHDYLKYQPSKEAVLQSREATKRRVNAHRNKRGNAVTNTNGNGVGTSALLGTGTGSGNSGSGSQVGEARGGVDSGRLCGDWGKRWSTKLLMPPREFVNDVARLMTEYAVATQDANLDALVDRCMKAFLSELASWNFEGAATPQMFIKKWPEIQTILAGRDPSRRREQRGDAKAAANKRGFNEAAPHAAVSKDRTDEL